MSVLQGGLRNCEIKNVSTFIDILFLISILIINLASKSTFCCREDILYLYLTPRAHWEILHRWDQSLGDQLTI